MSKKQNKQLTAEVLDKVNNLVATGLGLVAALAWNEAIKEIFEIYFVSPQQNVWAKILYALFITIVVVVVTVYLSWSLSQAKKMINQKNKTEDKK